MIVYEEYNVIVVFYITQRSKPQSNNSEQGLEGKTKKTTVYDYYSPTRLFETGFEYPAGWEEWDENSKAPENKEEPKDEKLADTSGEEKKNTDDPKDFRIAGASVYDGQKKELVTYETWGGMQKKFIYITEDDSFNLDRVIAYSYDNILDEYYEIKRKKYYFSPLSRKNSGKLISSMMKYTGIHSLDSLNTQETRKEISHFTPMCIPGIRTDR